MKSNRCVWSLIVVPCFTLIVSCATPIDRAFLESLYPPERPYPASAFTELGGARIHYRYSEPALKPGETIRGYVILLHGLAGSTFSWNYLMPELNGAGYATLAVDIPPFGFSSGDSSAFKDPAQAAPILWSLADSKFSGNWMVIAHSMGGKYAAAMAGAAPGRLELSVLFAPAIGDESGAPAFTRQPVAKGFIRSYLGATVRDGARLSKLLSGAYGRKPLPRELAGYAAPFALPGKVDAFTDWALGSPQASGPKDDASARRAASLFSGIPVLLIWGENDAWVPVSRGRALQAIIPGSRLDIIAGEGHCSMETAPDTVNELVLGFLEAH